MIGQQPCYIRPASKRSAFEVQLENSRCQHHSQFKHLQVMLQGHESSQETEPKALQRSYSNLSTSIVAVFSNNPRKQCSIGKVCSHPQDITDTRKSKGILDVRENPSAHSQ
ncbi:MAG: hypothetical protein EAX81_00045 [Candidatus Thorarchaeota archaeon]|nr:hypothetical protein [Candidatus Thorarchaeota archaeon]